VHQELDKAGQSDYRHESLRVPHAWSLNFQRNQQEKQQDANTPTQKLPPRQKIEPLDRAQFLDTITAKKLHETLYKWDRRKHSSPSSTTRMDHHWSIQQTMSLWGLWRGEAPSLVGTV
jgi:hypothetical protein